MEVPYEQIGLVGALIIALVTLAKVVKYMNSKIEAAQEEVKKLQQSRVDEMAAALLERDKLVRQSNMTVSELSNLLKRRTGHVELDGNSDSGNNRTGTGRTEET